MFIEPELVNILVNINSGYTKYRDVKGRVLTQIDKAMYGLVQSAKLWYETITGLLKDHAYSPNPMDPCVWNKNVHGDQITIIIYVDDLAISCRNKDEVHKAMAMVKEKFIDIKVKESYEMSYLGMNLKIDNDGIQVSMENYLHEMMKEFEELREYTHPADEKLFVNDGEMPSKDKKQFHKMVAKLLYLCERGRPDVALPVHYLCTRVQNPTDADDKKLARIMGYLKGTMGNLRKIGSKPYDRVEAYIDAAHACHEDGFGQSGGAIMVGDAMVEVIKPGSRSVRPAIVPKPNWWHLKVYCWMLNGMMNGFEARDMIWRSLSYIKIIHPRLHWSPRAAARCVTRPCA